jgi:hypothetical protein
MTAGCRRPAESVCGASPKSALTVRVPGEESVTNHGNRLAPVEVSGGRRSEDTSEFERRESVHNSPETPRGEPRIAVEDPPVAAVPARRRRAPATGCAGPTRRRPHSDGTTGPGVRTSVRTDHGAPTRPAGTPAPGAVFRVPRRRRCAARPHADGPSPRPRGGKAWPTARGSPVSSHSPRPSPATRSGEIARRRRPMTSLSACRRFGPRPRPSNSS